MGNKGQVGYPSGVSDEEWAFVAPYLALCRKDAPQRSHSLRSVFNALRWLVKTGAHWRMMPNDLPPARGLSADAALDTGRMTPLHHPAARQQDEAALGFSVLDHFELDPMLGGGGLGGFSGVSLIDISKLHLVSGYLLHLFGELLHLSAILLIGGRDVQGKQVAQGVHRGMHLRSFAPLGPIVSSPRPRLRLLKILEAQSKDKRDMAMPADLTLHVTSPTRPL